MKGEFGHILTKIERVISASPLALHTKHAQSALRADSKRGLSGSFSTAPIRANCLNLNQKKCKFLYDAQNALWADFENVRLSLARCVLEVPRAPFDHFPSS